jgi:hypothetical protein
MSLISLLADTHLLSINLQPDKTYFWEAMDPGDVDRLNEVMKGFRPGDGRILTLAAEEFDKWSDEESRQIKGALRRLAEMCKLMEEEA